VNPHRLSLCGLNDARSRPVPRTLEPDDELTIAAGELPLRPGHAALECGRDSACAGRHALITIEGWRPPLGPETGTVVWPGGADRAPDTLCERVCTGGWPDQDVAA
jgi:hypothetical protein